MSFFLQTKGVMEKVTLSWPHYNNSYTRVGFLVSLFSCFPSEGGFILLKAFTHFSFKDSDCPHPWFRWPSLLCMHLKKNKWESEDRIKFLRKACGLGPVGKTSCMGIRPEQSLRAHAPKGLGIGSMLCCDHLKLLNTFGPRGPTFSFRPGLHKFWRQCW